MIETQPARTPARHSCTTISPCRRTFSSRRVETFLYNTGSCSVNTIAQYLPHGRQQRQRICKAQYAARLPRWNRPYDPTPHRNPAPWEDASRQPHKNKAIAPNAGRDEADSRRATAWNSASLTPEMRALAGGLGDPLRGHHDAPIVAPGRQAPYKIVGELKVGAEAQARASVVAALTSSRMRSLAWCRPCRESSSRMPSVRAMRAWS
jgi:hypothetical protein